VTPFPLPVNLVESARGDRDPLRRAWIDALPGIVAGLQQRWGVEVGAPYQPGGETAWVAPARHAAGDELVLKVGWRHPESDHEADGLRAWSGRGAVLVRTAHREADTSALLMERCDPGTELGRTEPEPRQDEIVANLLRRLWHEPAAGHPFRPLQEMCDAWADECEADPNPRLDPGLAREGVALFRSLPAGAERAVLLFTDLHAGNVLAARREPWLVIDPKPYVGDPAYDPLQHMLNCTQRLTADPAALSDRMADLCGGDPARLRLWLFARCVVESSRRDDLLEVAARLAP